MPQETALMEEFTIREIIWFYGTIYGLSSKMIGEKVKFLSELLEFNDVNKYVKDCSGGQKRRVSLALTLVHDPELLIFDEPTVGLDPLLRAKIWDYFVEITTMQSVTVLLSTHYIEEARQSTHIGLMRDGVLLAQDSPQNVLRMIGTTCLEEAFLIMSQLQESKNLPGLTCQPHFEASEVALPNIDHNQHQVTEPDVKQHDNVCRVAKNNHLQPSPTKILFALLIKNFTEVWRNG